MQGEEMSERACPFAEPIPIGPSSQIDMSDRGSYSVTDEEAPVPSTSGRRPYRKDVADLCPNELAFFNDFVHAVVALENYDIVVEETRTDAFPPIEFIGAARHSRKVALQ